MCGVHKKEVYVVENRCKLQCAGQGKKQKCLVRRKYMRKITCAEKRNRQKSKTPASS